MGQLETGVAKANITPPIGFVERRASIIKKVKNAKPRGVLDELYAKALVVDDGSTRAALIALDLIDNDVEFTAGIRKLVEQLTGIPPENVLVAATHNHSSPGVRFVRLGGETDPAYLSEVQRKIAGAVYAASCHMRVAKIGAGMGEAPADLAGSNLRRVYWWFQGQDGVVINRSAPGLIDPDDPGAPIDRQIGVVRIDDAKGEALAALINYACHPTCLGPNNVLVSADYPGQTTVMIEAGLGGNALALFFQGAGGDIDPVHGLPRAEYIEVEDQLASPMYGDLRRMGSILAHEALRVLEATSTSSTVTIQCRSRMIELPWWEVLTVAEMEAMVESARRDLVAAGQEGFTWPWGADYGVERNLDMARSNLSWAKDKLAVLRSRHLAPGQSCEIQAISVGPVLFIGVSAELYCQIGLDIKQRLREARPDQMVFICGLTNGCFGYVPSPPAYEGEGGHALRRFAKYYDMITPVAPESGQILGEAIQQLVNQL
jgi:neutral ceramidase